MPIAPFAEWMYNHVRRLQSKGFPLPKILMRLSSLPSKLVIAWHSMYIQGVHFWCHSNDGGPHLHTTFDCGIAMKDDKHHDRIDVDIVNQVLMVDYSDLKPVLMKASWMKHFVQGHSTIKKDCHGLWMCKLDKREDPIVKNPYIFPCHVTQVFFMSDLSSPRWKVILSYEPRSHRIIGDREQQGIGASGSSIGMEDILSGHANTQQS